ncbi:Down syndrome cell adhesion molecule-like protein Dscam2 [Leptotrombidium deliense]|uniref:Down syndrome cell adhesion molecule-like protein Dscam2 n=1 Tax=Leptotrombidium deliense TaxID=299467 RepID=A0A443RWW3_9ACAR|nr:Down syndrome cell adhesion molecule-like protein Dscam2 [Leptotrombidium deliense]
MAMFRCHVPNYMRNYLNISWLKNDHLIDSDLYNEINHRKALKMFTLDGYLYVIGVNREDTFNSYKCRVVNRLTGETQSSATNGKIIITGLRLLDTKHIDYSQQIDRI